MSDALAAARRPFNGPIETGLRSLFVLDAISPRSRDLQRLVYYDYLLLHSRDIGDDGLRVHQRDRSACRWWRGLCAVVYS
jgi:hypothetical protein